MLHRPTFFVKTRELQNPKGLSRPDLDLLKPETLRVYPTIRIMTKPVPLEPGQVYHIYNRGTNRENVFIE